MEPDTRSRILKPLKTCSWNTVRSDDAAHDHRDGACQPRRRELSLSGQGGAESKRCFRRRRLGGLNEQRLAAARCFRAEAKGAPLKPRQIVEAFFGVAIRMGATTRAAGTSCASWAALYEPSEFVRTFLARSMGGNCRFKAAFFRRCPMCRRTISLGVSIS